MKSLSLFFVLVSFGAWGEVESLSFEDHLRVPQVVMDEVLLGPISHLYSDLYFGETLIASLESNKNEVIWSEKPCVCHTKCLEL